jgi:hypothetical protein
MKLHHRINFASKISFQDSIMRFRNFESCWQGIEVKIDRIIFSTLSQTRWFLEKLPYTNWGLDNLCTTPKGCQGKCSDSEMISPEEQQLSNELNLSPPSIHCGLNTAYELEPLLNVFGHRRSEVQVEILIENQPESLENTRYFIEDKIDDYNFSNTTPPVFSIIQPIYEIQYETDGEIKNKKHTKIPITFNRIIKKLKPNWYPRSIGKEYYGQSVLKSVIQFIEHAPSNQMENISQLFPIKSIKYYDFQEEGHIEIRFKQLVPIKVFFRWMETLQKIQIEHETKILMMRLRFVYESWTLENYFKSASLDQFFFTWNDVEEALLQRNYSNAKKYIQDPLQNDFSTIYFDLTSTIDNLDPRVEFLQKIWGNPPELI